jgi:DNA-binding MarR family transcriptional regulator
MQKSENGVGSLDSEQEITLGLLNVIQENSSSTQRSVANELGIALGLVNAYLKRCVKKGWIKVTEAPANRYFYYLTPYGFAEKSKLTREYLSQSFNFFRQSRLQCSNLLAHAAARGWKRLVLYGVGDLAEISTLCAKEFPVKLIAVIDAEAGIRELAGLPVHASLGDVRRVDAVILTDLKDPQGSFDALAAELPPERILVPELLNVSTQPPVLME